MAKFSSTASTALATLALCASAAGAQNTGTTRMASMPGRDGRIERACGSAGDSTVRIRRSVGDSLNRVSSTASMAAESPSGTTPITGGTTRSHEYPEYDVVLDIPNLCVQNIHLKVDTVTAKINLDARVSGAETFTQKAVESIEARVAALEALAKQHLQASTP